MYVGLCIVIACVVLMCGTPAFALNPARDVMSVRAHSMENPRGLLPKAYSRHGQTPDGYLWLGTEFGLLRFGRCQARRLGASTRSVLSRPAVIYNLLAARDGSLWIATAKGLAVWKDGRLTQIAELAGQIVFPLSRSGSAVWRAHSR
jgi:ligand-binding sensor domain-containing protein